MRKPDVHDTASIQGIKKSCVIRLGMIVPKVKFQDKIPALRIETFESLLF